ncbi:Alpha-ketoglutarate-dependent dioxygenase alkB [Penicillium cataractarum]|uniref:Alpha-ketoglutarate-dependent dioxygenase alkB n=1 Tax=Penicillium cataractarum TaxID=2100454 RepID=A0A9W9RPQ4_9EURO|nr:Alpha-ketoglutarate-dependent dioxygenase alkB [Penicillium cataractarum]KAJ5364117.1 Alpha-ketoglutarate-dependent dioxygenase alkB [Penicillium cataractarum]
MVWDLEAARITSLPDDTFYIPNFISEEEEQVLLQKISSAPLPRWTHLTHRRLQTWPSALTKTNTLLSSPLPSWLITPIIEPRFKQLGIFADAPHAAPNHVLINEYRPGQGIMPHEDGPAYYPLVATVSLGAAIVLDLYEKEGEEGKEDLRIPRFRVLQERRSLLVTRGKMYTDFLHGIAERVVDGDLGAETVCNWGLLGEKDGFMGGSYERMTRTSLTYRDVLKVAKVGNTLKFLGGR